MLKEIKRHIKIPVIAIGGINTENLESVIDSGADAVAVSSAIIQGDIADNAIRFLEYPEKIALRNAMPKKYLTGQAGMCY